jgi:hypothetical protein
MAMRGSRVTEAPSFVAGVKTLSDRYPAIREAIEDFKLVLKQLDSRLPMQKVSDMTARVYSQKMDYAALGSGGRGRFIVVLHATEPNPSMQHHFQTFTLLAIYEAPETLN